MKLVMFVQQTAASAGKPGEKVNAVRLMLPPKGDQIDDDNKDVFPDVSKKSGSFEAQGITDELLAQFGAGKRVTVTFEVEK